MLALFVLASLAASTTEASSRTLPHPRRSATRNAPNPSCPLWEVGWWFVGDITVPDDTHFAPGTAFHKGWRLQNCGRQDWTEARAVRVANVEPGRMELPGAPSQIDLPNAVSRAVFEVWSWMTAPSGAGHYRATYKVHANGFELDNYFWVDIWVDGGGTFTLSVTTAGSGTVTSRPAGISCGSQCSASFAAGTAVTLDPRPATGYHFASWSGDSDCSDGVVQMVANRSCTATFALDTGASYSLTVGKIGSGRGTVSGPGIGCGGDCSEVLPGGTFVVLSATPDSKSRFDG
jgi:hypothetical protein